MLEVIVGVQGKKYFKWSILDIEYPQLRQDGVPDLVYSNHTNGYICVYCEGVKCNRCFKSGYMFVDPDLYHTLVLEIYEKRRL